MAEIQHESIPDSLLHEAKHAITASENTFLRAKGNGETEFVELNRSSVVTPVTIRDDTVLANSFPYIPTLGYQYNFVLRKQVGEGTAAVDNYEQDILDLRGVSFLPTGSIYLESVGGRVRYTGGAFVCVDTEQVFIRATEIR